MTSATNLVEHEVFCLPRPGELEPRMESFSAAISAGDGRPLGHRDVVRCIECGSQSVDGRPSAA